MIINLPFQMEFILNLTYRCNLRCEMCTQYGDNYKEKALEELDIKYWLNFLDEIKDINPKPKIILMGGEPFLYKDFTTLFKTAHKFGIKTHIITNGLLLDKYLDILKETDTSITISIDGLNDIHDNIRGLNGLFKKVVQNIDLIDKCQKEGSKIELRINHVLLPKNIENMVEFHKFFKKYNVETFTFQHIQSSTKELNEICKKQFKERLNQDCVTGLIPKENYNFEKNFIEKLKHSFDKFKDYCTYNNCFEFPALDYSELYDYYTNNNLDNLRKQMVCTTPWLNPAIHPNGDVGNCIFNVIGNIKTESFWDIWNSEKAQKFRDCLIKNGKFTICAKCCNFYKDNFIPAVDGKIEINNIKMQLPDELNYIQSSKRVAFIEENKSDNEYISAIPINIHNERMYDEIKEKYKVITTIE